MYKTALKKSVLLISLALSAAAPAVDLNQHLSFDYRIPGDSIGDLRTGLTANACHSLTDPMVIRLSLADIDWKQYDVNLKINGQPINAVMTPFKQDTDLVKPFLVSSDSKLTNEFLTANKSLKPVKVYRALNPYCLRPRSASGGTNVDNQNLTDSGYHLYGLAGHPPFGEGSKAHPDEWDKCKAHVIAVDANDNSLYPQPITIGAGKLRPYREPLVYDYEQYVADQPLSQYRNAEHRQMVQAIINMALEQSRNGNTAVRDAVDNDFWLKYMFYKTGKYEDDTKLAEDGTTRRWPKEPLSKPKQNNSGSVNGLKEAVDYTMPHLDQDIWHDDRVVGGYLNGNVNYYTSQRNIQSIVLTVTRKAKTPGQVPATHSFTWTRYGTGDMKKNVLLLSHTGDLVKPSAEQYAADYYQKQGFYATTPGFYRGTLIASAGLNTKYTNNPAPLSRPAGMNGSINLVNTNDLTLRLTRNETTGEINALFYGQPLQFADLKFGEQKIMAKRIRDVCY